jgi:hypothetical protein
VKSIRTFPMSHLFLISDVAWLMLQPQYRENLIKWFRSERAEHTKAVTDEQLGNTLEDAWSALAAMVTSSRGNKVLILRDVALASHANPITITGNDPPGVVSVGLVDDEGGSVGSTWILSRDSAKQLLAMLQEHLGEPEMEQMMDRTGAEKVSQEFDRNAIHTGLRTIEGQQ